MKLLKITCSLVFTLLLTSCLESNIKTLGSSTGLSSSEDSYEWVQGNWGGCSVTACGQSGTQLRQVICRKDDGSTVADSFCITNVGPKPATSQSCSTNPCPGTYSWLTGSWSACSATACGTAGTQTRTVVCRDSNGATVADSNCTSAKPASSQACSAAACQSCTLDGVTVAHGASRNFYTTASVACGQTCPVPQSRTCTNGTLSGASTYNKAACSVATCTYTYAWESGAWGACSTTACGTTGTQTRTVTCKRNDGQTAADANCTGTKPATSQACTNGPCGGGSFAWVTGLNTTPATNMSLPALNVPYTDPAYGLKISRVTDSSQTTNGSFVRHEYSRRSAFNSDGSYALLMAFNNGHKFKLYSVDKAGNKLNFVKDLTVGGTIEPNWHPTDPNVFYYLSGQKIMTYNVSTDAKATARDLTGRIPFGPSDATMWTKEEGRPSDDGRIWCFMVEKYNSSSQSVTHYGLIAYNLETDQIVGSMAVSSRPDHISTSPKGNYCVPSWDTANGTRAYSLNFASFTQLHTKSEHSDLATTKDGKEVYVFSDYNSGDVAMVDMASGTRTNLFRLYGTNSSASALHVSGVGSKGKPGYVVVGFYACSENYGAAACSDSQWFKNKLVISELKANPTIYNLAHNQYGNAGYFSETQAVASYDLSKILFVSSWRSTTENAISSYMIDVPVNTLP